MSELSGIYPYYPLFWLWTTLTCLGGLPGVFFPFDFKEESVILLAWADIDLGLPTLGFTNTCGV